MPELIKEIDTAEGPLVFKFDRIYTINGFIYFVSVFKKNVQHFFNMEKRRGVWKIVKAPEPPYWLFIHEEKLAKFVEAHEGRR